MKTFLNKIAFILVTTIIISCGGNENENDIIIEEGTTQILIRANKYNIVLNPENQEQFEFTVTTNSGTDITSQSLIYVDNTEINSNILNPTELKSYKVKARFQNLESEEITINVVDIASTYYKHKVIVEDFTGTWCGWCTRISYAIELIEQQTHNVIPIAIHNNDEYDYSGRMTLENYIGVNGAYPYATINRKTIWTPLQHQNTIQPISKINTLSPIGIKISSDLGQNSGTINVTLNFKESVNEQLKYVVYVLENGLIADQKNYYNTLYGGIMPTLPNFTHNHTLRGVYGNIIGNNITQNIVADQEINLNNLSVSYTSENSNNLKVVVFVTNNNGEVLNAQIADANTSNDFELAQ